MLKHFTDVVIPLADKLKVPDEPPIDVPCAPTMKTLGTTMDLELEQNEMKCDIEAMKKEGYAERDRREDAGESDRWTEMQRTSPPDIDNKLKGYKIEKCFEYFEDDGSAVLQWCPGVVKSIKNKKTKLVTIEWDP